MPVNKFKNCKILEILFYGIHYIYGLLLLIFLMFWWAAGHSCLSMTHVWLLPVRRERSPSFELAFYLHFCFVCRLILSGKIEYFWVGELHDQNFHDTKFCLRSSNRLTSLLSSFDYIPFFKIFILLVCFVLLFQREDTHKFEEYKFHFSVKVIFFPRRFGVI